MSDNEVSYQHSLVLLQAFQDARGARDRRVDPGFWVLLVKLDRAGRCEHLSEMTRVIRLTSPYE